MYKRIEKKTVKIIKGVMGPNLSQKCTEFRIYGTRRWAMVQVCQERLG